MKKRKKRLKAKKKNAKIENKEFKKISWTYLLGIIFLLMFIFIIIYFSYSFNLFKGKSEIIKEEIKIGDRSFIFSKKVGVEKAPVIIVLHGGLQDSSVWFEENSQGLFVKNAIEEGYAIIAPDSLFPLCEGIKQWDYRKDSSDLIFFDEIFNWIWFREDLNSDDIYVAGISIGGFMASRLANHYGQNIKAIAVHSGGNADNIDLDPNNLCYVEYNFGETKIKEGHPRTLIIHGTNDSIIPYETSVAYYSSLKKAGVGVKLIPKQDEEHYWYSEYNGLVLEWFD